MLARLVTQYRLIIEPKRGNLSSVMLYTWGDEFWPGAGDTLVLLLHKNGRFDLLP